MDESAARASLLLNAGWNAVLEFGNSRFQGMMLLSLGHGIVGIVLVAICPLPGALWFLAGFLLRFICSAKCLWRGPITGASLAVFTRLPAGQHPSSCHTRRAVSDKRAQPAAGGRDCGDRIGNSLRHSRHSGRQDILFLRVGSTCVRICLRLCRMAVHARCCDFYDWGTCLERA